MAYGKGYQPKVATKLIYNCDPSNERGYLFDGNDAKVPPLGHEDNPQEWPTHVVSHILHHDHISDIGVRGWLTDKKEEYEKALEFFKANGYARNLENEHVISNPKEGGVFILTPEQNEKVKAKAQQAAVDKMIESLGVPRPGESGKRKPRVVLGDAAR